MIDHTNSGPSRRQALLGAAAASALAAQSPHSIPIIDTHFHLYDPTRPQGAPFPRVPNSPPFLPKHFKESATPLGIVGGIKVEASPWVEDNLWVLMIIENEPMIVGMVGNLDPTKPDFREYLGRYHRNKLFLGIRFGNVWEGQDLVAGIERPECIENLKAFAQTGLTLEVANPRFDLIEATRKLAEKVPDLRIVLGHLQALPLPKDPAVMRSYTANLKALAERKAFVKVSGLPRTAPGGQGSADPAVFKPALDLFWELFGDDQMVYAGRNKNALDTLMAYTMAKSPAAAEKFFWKNSIRAFKWIKRDPNQPQLA